MRLTCSSCHARLASTQSFAGECATCGAPICFRCWAVGTRTCAAHAEPQAVPVEPGQSTGSATQGAPASKQVVVCAHCGKELATAPLPHSKPNYCIDCQEELSRIPADLPDGAVTFEDARYFENLFHRFVADSLQKLTVWPGPEGLPRRKLVQREVESQGRLPDDFLAGHPFKDALEKRLVALPENRCVHIDALYKKRFPWRRNKRHVELVVASCVPLQPLLDRGYITQAAGPGQLDILIKGSVDADSDRLVVAFSPTGWDETFPIPDGTVVVSLRPDGTWHTREHVRDEALRPFVKVLFDAESSEEKIERCVEAVKHYPPEKLPLSARRLSEEMCLPFHLVAQSFRLCARQGKGYIVCDDPKRDDWLLDLQ